MKITPHPSLPRRGGGNNAGSSRRFVPLTYEGPGCSLIDESTTQSDLTVGKGDKKKFHGWSTRLDRS